MHGGIQLAHDPWDGTTSVYTKLPTTREGEREPPGQDAIVGPDTSRNGSARLTGGPHETFGDGSVTVRYSGAEELDASRRDGLGEGEPDAGDRGSRSRSSPRPAS